MTRAWNGWRTRVFPYGARHLVRSWDLWTAALAAALSSRSLPWTCSIAAAKDIYQTAISVLSIVFAVFFAALAVVITAPSDDFIEFMQQDDGFGRLTWNFRWTLFCLCFALGFAMVLASRAAIRVASREEHELSAFLVTLCFAGVYALCAAAQAAGDCISFAHYRVKYLAMRERDNTAQSADSPTRSAGRDA